MKKTRRDFIAGLTATPNALIMETYPGVQSQYPPRLQLYPVTEEYMEVPEEPSLGIDVSGAESNMSDYDLADIRSANWLNEK